MKRLGIALVLSGVIWVACNQQITIPFEYSFTVSLSDIHMTSQQTALLQTQTSFYKRVIDVGQYWSLYNQLQNFIQNVTLDSARVRIINASPDSAKLWAFVSADTSLDMNTVGQADSLAHFEIGPNDTVTISGTEYLNYFYASGIQTLVNDLIPSGLFAAYLLAEAGDSLDLFVDSLTLFITVSGEQ